MASWSRIRALQQKLNETYSKPSTTRLTERNISDLVLQLVQDADLQVIFSEDGLEYITPRQLLKEIEYEVSLQGGRLSIFGLASTLGVNDVHVERQLQKIVSEGHGSLFFIPESNELLNEDYNAHLIAKLSIQLDSAGTARVPEFASKNALPLKYIDNLITKSLENGSLLAEKDEAGISLFKSDYIGKFTSLLRSALAATTRPITVAKLLGQHPNLHAPTSIVSLAVESLSSGQNLVPGIFETKRGTVTYYPNIFISARKEWIQSVLKKDLYIPLKTLEKLEVTATNSSILGQDTFVLPQSVVSVVLVEHLESLVLECVQENGIFAFLPPNIPEEMSKVDLKALLTLERCQSFISLGRVIGGNYFVSKVFVDRCLKLYQQKFLDEARVEAPAETSEGHIILSASTLPRSHSQRSSPSTSVTITRGSIFEQIKTWCPNQRKYETALSLLAEDLVPQITSMAQSNPSQTGPSALETRAYNLKDDEWFQTFQASYLNLIFFLSAIETLPTAISPDQRQQLSQHVLESLGKGVLKQITSACNQKYMLGEAREDVLEGIKLFPSESSKPLISLLKLMDGSDKATKKTAKKLIDSVLSVLGYPAPQMDPDTQSKILKTHCASALSQLQSQPPAEPSTRLRLALGLIHSKLSGFMLLTTTRHLQMIIHSLKSDLTSRGNTPVFPSTSNTDLISNLDTCYAALLASIRAKQSKNTDQIRDALSNFEEKFSPILECSTAP